jgi:IstB-like ATP binding protein
MKKARSSSPVTRALGTGGGNQVIGTAILDRLLHHSIVINIRGESYRPREKQRTGLLKPDPAEQPEVTLGVKENYPDLSVPSLGERRRGWSCS